MKGADQHSTAAAHVAVWGRLLETSELQFESTSIYFRTPHSETTSRGVNQMNEIVALWPPVSRGPYPEATRITDDDNPEWKAFLGKALKGVELLMDFKSTDFHGIRLIFHDDSSLDYHYQWGASIDDPIPRHIAIYPGCGSPPLWTGWKFIPWIWTEEILMVPPAVSELWSPSNNLFGETVLWMWCRLA